MKAFRWSVCLLSLGFLGACTATQHTQVTTGQSSNPAASATESPSPDSIPYTPAPPIVRTADGLQIPVPAGWYGRDLTPQSVGSYWDLIDHNPAVSKTEGLAITLRTATATASDLSDVGRCPKTEEETKIESCGFVSFGGYRWRRIVGETDIPFIELETVSGRGFYRLLGFYPRKDKAALSRVESILREATIR